MSVIKFHKVPELFSNRKVRTEQLCPEYMYVWLGFSQGKYFRSCRAWPRTAFDVKVIQSVSM